MEHSALLRSTSHISNTYDIYSTTSLNNYTLTYSLSGRSAALNRSTADLLDTLQTATFSIIILTQIELSLSLYPHKDIQLKRQRVPGAAPRPLIVHSH